VASEIGHDRTSGPGDSETWSAWVTETVGEGAGSVPLHVASHTPLWRNSLPRATQADLLGSVMLSCRFRRQDQPPTHDSGDTVFRLSNSFV